MKTQENHCNIPLNVTALKSNWTFLRKMSRTPIVTAAQQSYGFKVIAVSDVGGNFGPFEGRKDTGLIRNLNPYGEAPLLFLVHKDGKEIYPIARGITDLDQIGENILMIIKYSKGEGSNEKN